MEYGKIKIGIRVKVHMDPKGNDYESRYQDKIGTVECIGSIEDPLCKELVI